MANRTHRSRQKLTFRVDSGKPRNPLVVPALQRAAGRHGKSGQALRARARRLVKKEVDGGD